MKIKKYRVLVKKKNVKSEGIKNNLKTRILKFKMHKENFYNKNSQYNLKEFVSIYKCDIERIFEMIINYSKREGFKIADRENLFKNIISCLYINSDTKKLKI